MTAPATIRESEKRRSALRWGLGVAAVLFGAATLVSGGKVLFGGAAARADAGAVVDFVLLFNFGAGFAYILTGLGVAMHLRWSLHVARFLAGANLAVFAAFGVHIALGGAFEMRTVAAMTLRLGFWVGQALALAHVFRAASGQLFTSRPARS